MATAAAAAAGGFSAAISRARVRPKRVYKRVMLVSPEPGKPIWKAMWTKHRFKLWPLAWEGRVWIEHSMYNSALQTRIVRKRWPNQMIDDEFQEDPNLAASLANQGMHVLDCKILDDMISSTRGRVKSGATVVTAAMVIMLTEGWAVVPWWSSLIFCVVFALMARVVLKGGFGNTGVAKQVCGVTNPFILTPYQLVRHIEKRRELVEQEGVVF